MHMAFSNASLRSFCLRRSAWMVAWCASSTSTSLQRSERMVFSCAALSSLCLRPSDWIVSCSSFSSTSHLCHKGAATLSCSCLSLSSSFCQAARSMSTALASSLASACKASALPVALAASARHLSRSSCMLAHFLLFSCSSVSCTVAASSCSCVHSCRSSQCLRLPSLRSAMTASTSSARRCAHWCSKLPCSSSTRDASSRRRACASSSSSCLA
mmetsp:Transcript_31964/g.88332  ORF Transcript_31964/g.88332 Transcript_31964/m.88332 type:complete len:214 (+) Transcript_31964:285-926(+)